MLEMQNETKDEFADEIRINIKHEISDPDEQDKFIEEMRAMVKGIVLEKMRSKMIRKGGESNYGYY